MRLLLFVLAIFAAVISLSLWSNHMLRTSASELVQNIDRIESALKSNNWDEAYKGTTELEGTWEDKAGWWPIVLDHAEIDNIKFSLAKVKQYVAAKNLALAWGQVSELKLVVEHIPEKEAVLLKNIL